MVENSGDVRETPQAVHIDLKDSNILVIDDSVGIFQLIIFLSL